jgi:hypothetical protein
LRIEVLEQSNALVCDVQLVARTNLNETWSCGSASVDDGIVKRRVVTLPPAIPWGFQPRFFSCECLWVT